MIPHGECDTNLHGAQGFPFNDSVTRTVQTLLAVLNDIQFVAGPFLSPAIDTEDTGVAATVVTSMCNLQKQLPAREMEPPQHINGHRNISKIYVSLARRDFFLTNMLHISPPVPSRGAP